MGKDKKMVEVKIFLTDAEIKKLDKVCEKLYGRDRRSVAREGTMRFINENL